MNDDTWTCHICKEERPDRFISVFKKTKMRNGIELQENIRYCNDRPTCREGAQTFSHFKEDFNESGASNV